MRSDVDEARSPSGSAVVAGAAYFAVIFALGFVLGTVRTLFVQDRPGSGRLVGVLLFGRTVQQHWALYRDASYAIGLAAQLAFALMPLPERQWSR